MNAQGAALVGASDASFWMRWAVRNLESYGYKGDIWPMNPRHAEVFGRPAYPSITDVPGTPRHVIVAVGTAGCVEVVRQAAAMGAENIAVITNGFAEGPHDLEGVALQRELVDACAGASTTLYGPNCVGYADFSDDVCFIAEPIPPRLRAGSVSYLSQSGALVSAGLGALHEDGLGIDWCVSLGNAARLDVAGALARCVERPTTDIICLFAETLGPRLEAVAAVLDAARNAAKPVIVLKVGRTAQGTRAALTHTASVAGDDEDVDAFLRRHGAIRVDTIDEMARVATVARLVPPDRRGRGVAVMGSSGGLAGWSADLAARHGVELARLAPETVDRVAEMAGPLSFIENPFDLAGLPSSRHTTEDIYDCVAADPAVGVLVYPDDSPDNEMHRESIWMMRRVAHRSGTPVLVPSLAQAAWTPWIDERRADDPMVVIVQGLDVTFQALRHFFPTSGAADG